MGAAAVVTRSKKLVLPSFITSPPSNCFFLSQTGDQQQDTLLLFFKVSEWLPTTVGLLWMPCSCCCCYWVLLLGVLLLSSAQHRLPTPPRPLLP